MLAGLIVAGLLAMSCDDQAPVDRAEHTSPGPQVEPEGADEGGASPSPAPTWPGPELPESGEIPVDGFEDFLTRTAPLFATSPIRTALEFLRIGDLEGNERLTVRARGPGLEEEGRDRAVVTVTMTRIPDDSVGALRYVVRLSRRHEGTWRLVSASWAQRCQPGRGHQDFTAEPCV